MSEPIVIKRGRRVRCKHFTGIGVDTCRAGVAYTTVAKDHEPIRFKVEGAGDPGLSIKRSLPCLPDRNLGGATCEKCELPTPEEAAAEEREMEERFERMTKARAAIVAHLGGPWKRGVSGASGRIDCPACGKPDGLGFSRSGYNGHIHARCDTPGCCCWME